MPYTISRRASPDLDWSVRAVVEDQQDAEPVKGRALAGLLTNGYETGEAKAEETP